MADARAGVDVVGAERGAHELLHQEGLLVGAARGRDAADGLAAVLRLDAAELGRGVGDRLVPADSRHGSVICSRIIGVVMRSACVA